jgi:hypothetical protein
MGGWFGPFMYERMSQGLKAYQFCWVNVRAKARTYLPVPTLRGSVPILRGRVRV